MAIDLLITIMLSGASINAPNPPPVSAVRDDLRCIGAASALQHLNQLQGDDANRRASLLAFTLYYIGKVKGAKPDIDLAAAIRELGQIPREPEAADPIVTSCLEEFRQVGDQLRNAGESLENGREE